MKPETFPSPGPVDPAPRSSAHPPHLRLEASQPVAEPCKSSELGEALAAMAADPVVDDSDFAIDRWIESRPDWPNDWPGVTQCQLTALIGEALEHWSRPVAQIDFRLRSQRRVVLPGESVAEAPPLPWDENPPPECFDPLVLVVSQQTAMRALVRHYGWVHCGPDTLVRPRYSVKPSAASSEPAPCGGVVEDLVEAPGSIADQAAAAAAAVA